MSSIRSVLNVLDLDILFDELDKKKNEKVSARDIDGKFHPSSLGDCGRKLYYAFNKTPPKHNISPRLRRTFDHGHVVHDWVQSKLRNVFDTPDMPFTLEIEKSINDTVFAHDHNLAGSADALITATRDINDDIKQGDCIVYELKTASSATWNSLRSPIAKHEIQANCYAACFNAKWILFDYFNKDKDVHKRFLVEADAKRQGEISDMLFDAMFTCSKGEEIAREPNSWSCESCQYYYICKPEVEGD